MTGDRRFRFGVLASAARDGKTWRQQAIDAEAFGYRCLCVPDHLGQEWAPLVALTIAACATSGISLGTLMLAADLRLPSVLFKELATLAQIAPGRLEVGLGAGWLATDYRRAGLPMAPAAERIARLDEAVTILKKLWQDRSVTFHGTYYTVHEAVGQPIPPPGQVRWVLGGGGRRMLAVAAAQADVISLGARLSNSGKGSEFGQSAMLCRFDERVSWIRADAGDRFDDIEFSVLVHACAITDDRDRYASRVLTRMFGLSGDDALASPLTLVGSVDEICDKLLRLRDRLGISYWVVPAAQMRPFADVVARLDGG
ncbi:MAG TPA: TIGR03621 family F420-dependent LLM class oxidoreductase [Streptosporangiaceae bacterium]|nr:TIGR03621 family F420-dependent LLM class oxidoreductase [Streptosporangiaceae bacterium]